MSSAPSGLSATRGFSLQLPNELLEEPPCPVCGANEPELVMPVSDRLFGKPGEYGLVSCRECSARYLCPRAGPEALAAHYPDDYFIYMTPDKAHPLLRPILARLGRSRWLAYIRRFERAVGRFDASCQIVDVGCGQNNFLATLRDVRGCQGIGVDFKPEMSAFVRDALGMEVFAGTLQQARFADGKFDVVTMSEYLEHEPDPPGVLSEAHRITKRGGHVAIEIPFIEGVPAKLFGSRWSQIDPRHLSYFTRDTLARLLERTGFKLLHTETFQMPFNLGMSVLQACGLRNIGRMGIVESTLMAATSLPFLLAYPWMDEFMFAIARAE
ncbi:MAG TPA: methyltransferase domain-containing protein [Polyangiales bacterium]|nr:methyltransferase domain-containing protein [Polyangiales bacterium]